MSVIEAGLTEEQSREYSEAFNDLDKNNTGMLTKFELGVLMRSLNHTPTDEDLHIIAGDAENGVTIVDFLNIMAKREQETALQDKLAKAFSVFDNDGSGFISVGPNSDFRTQMMTLGPNPYTEADWTAFMAEYMESVAPQQHSVDDELCDYSEMVRLMLKK